MICSDHDCIRFVRPLTIRSDTTNQISNFFYFTRVRRRRCSRDEATDSAIQLLFPLTTTQEDTFNFSSRRQLPATIIVGLQTRNINDLVTQGEYTRNMKCTV